MDLTKLHAVVVIAEVGSLRQAADRLHCSQPALSQILKSVERDLGVELFERHPAGLRLRPAMQDVIAEIRRLVDRGRRLQEMAGALAHGRTGRLDLAVVNSATETVVPLLLDDWQERFPDCRLALQVNGPAQQIRALLSEDIDAGLLRQPVVVDGLVTHAVLSEPLVFAIPRSWEGGLPDDARTMVRFPAYHGPGLVEAIAQAVDLLGREPRDVVEVNDMASLLALVGAGHGWALVPACLASRQPCRVRYVALPDAVQADATVELALAVRTNDERPVIGELLAALRRAALTYRRDWRGQVEAM